MLFARQTFVSSLVLQSRRYVALPSPPLDAQRRLYVALPCRVLLQTVPPLCWCRKSCRSTAAFSRQCGGRKTGPRSHYRWEPAAAGHEGWMDRHGRMKGLTDGRTDGRSRDGPSVRRTDGEAALWPGKCDSVTAAAPSIVAVQNFRCELLLDINFDIMISLLERPYLTMF